MCSTHYFFFFYLSWLQRYSDSILSFLFHPSVLGLHSTLVDSCLFFLCCSSSVLRWVCWLVILPLCCLVLVVNLAGLYIHLELLVLWYHSSVFWSIEFLLFVLATKLLCLTIFGTDIAWVWWLVCICVIRGNGFYSVHALSKSSQRWVGWWCFATCYAPWPSLWSFFLGHRDERERKCRISGRNVYFGL